MAQYHYFCDHDMAIFRLSQEMLITIIMIMKILPIPRLDTSWFPQSQHSCTGGARISTIALLLIFIRREGTSEPRNV